MSEPYLILKPKCVQPEDVLKHFLAQQKSFLASPLLYSENNSSSRIRDDAIRRSKSLASRGIDSLISRICRDAYSQDSLIEKKLGLPKLRWPHTTGSCITYNDGDFVVTHQDYMRSVFGDRLIGCLYYFHKQPKQFEGGEFILYRNGEKFTIEPENGSLVLFSAALEHEVQKISVPSSRFEDGRFVLAGFLWEAGSLLKRSEVGLRKVLGPYSAFPPLAAIKRYLRRVNMRSLSPKSS